MEDFNIYNILSENFTKISSSLVNIEEIINENNIGDIRIILVGYTLYMFDKNNLDRNLYNIGYIDYKHLDHLKHKSITIKLTDKIYFNNYDSVYYPYIINKDNFEMLNEEIRVIKNKNKFINLEIGKINFVCIIENVLGSYYLNYYTRNELFNKSTFHNYIPRNSSNNKKIISLLKEDKYCKTIISCENKLKVISDNIVSNKINSPTQIVDKNINLLKNNYALFNYQKNDIKWMNKIENNILDNNNVIIYNYIEDDIFNINNNQYCIKYGANEKHHYLAKCNNDQNIIYTNYKYYGGNIISQVGLGKTLITLHYILEKCVENKQRELYHHYINDYNNLCNYTYKRGINKGTNCKKKSINLYCKEHSSSIFSEKINLIYSDMITKFHINNFIDNNKIKTNSTLILCPNQLCDQWIKEYYDKFNQESKFRVLMIVTKDQYTNLTVGDILFSDIVIISYQFLLTKFYKTLTYENALHLINGNQRFDEQMKVLNNKNFNLNVFKWERIVLDEAHEIQNMASNAYLLNIIYNLTSIFKWNITGTPFSNKLESFKYLSSYNTSLSTCNDINDSLIESSIVLFRKNTKESIKEEYTDTIITEYNKILKFTKEEENIYKSYIEENNGNIQFLIKLCCHPELNYKTRKLVENCKSFTEIQNVILSHNKSLLRDLLIKKNMYIRKINDTNNEISNNNNNYAESLRMDLANYKRNLTNIEKEYSNIERIYNYLFNSIESLKKNDESDVCPICLDEFDKPSITKCGHKFCWDCIKITFKNNTSCPTCKGVLTSKDIFIYEKIKEYDKNIIQTELDILVNNIKSTKIGNIIYFLKNDIKQVDKIILFSQWDEMLHKVGNLLEENNIKISYCNGSIYQRTRSIKEFNEKDCNIILLSSCNAASGINLTIANKIILLEPIYGDIEYRKSIESQAIGRCYRIGQKRDIEVYRFIIGNTVEEDIINDKMNVRQLLTN